MKNSPLSILVVAAHPDDEILGCGGTMAKHVTKGDEVNVLIMAEGVTSRDSERDREKRENELSELTKAAKIAKIHGGFHVEADQSYSIGQIQVVDIDVQSAIPKVIAPAATSVNVIEMIAST